MKTITICQPHAHFIAHGPKRVENRTWRTTHRGPIAIHAGKSLKYFRGLSTSHLFRCYGLNPPPINGPAAMVFGAVIAVADLIDVVAYPDVFDHYPAICPTRYVQGPWCWILDNVRTLERPIPSNGKQSLWNIADDVIATAVAA
jgi:hypothetical protein